MVPVPVVPSLIPTQWWGPQRSRDGSCPCCPFSYPYTMVGTAEEGAEMVPVPVVPSLIPKQWWGQQSRREGSCPCCPFSYPYTMVGTTEEQRLFLSLLSLLLSLHNGRDSRAAERVPVPVVPSLIPTQWWGQRRREQRWFLSLLSLLLSLHNGGDSRAAERVPVHVVPSLIPTQWWGPRRSRDCSCPCCPFSYPYTMVGTAELQRGFLSMLSLLLSLHNGGDHGGAEIVPVPVVPSLIPTQWWGQQSCREGSCPGCPFSYPCTMVFSRPCPSYLPRGVRQFPYIYFFHFSDNNIVDPNLRENYRLCKMSAVVKQLIAFCLRPIFPRISKVVHSSVGARSLMDSWADQTALQDYQAEFISEWRKLGLDVVLCPMLGPAFNKGYAARLLATISYTMLYNVLQFPAGVVPVGSVTRDDEEELKNYRGYDNDPWDWLYREALSGGVGLPLSVQCVALPYQDELCLRLMKEVETLRR
ncbi:uncharacterized protein LOC130307630 isoform X1 [Hyla sarda]|uniref:uncharacterized protein LOC130307630 isoform X1 n=1 Tax=Hyla sarda TaxID=327740 RepID=UPI0024C3AE67|nr:uncharacterized protein LOC130307630 isoform X1 [Hyla sarda]